MRRVAALTALLLSAWLGGCALLSTRQTECSEARPCAAGLSCDPETSTCVQAGAQTEMMALPDLQMDLPDLSAGDLMSACAAESDCPSGRACKDRVCTACAVHDDCQSKVCDFYQVTPAGRGKCIDRASLVYVDNKGGGACTSGDGSSPASSRCTIGEAIGQLGGVKTAVRLMPSAGAYSLPRLTGNTLTIYGPAGQGGDRAQLSTPGGTAIDVSGSSSVIVDGVEVVRSVVGANCNGGGGPSNLRLHRLVIDGTESGATIGGCMFELDRSVIKGTTKVALSLTGAESYVVVNSFIVANSSALGAVIVAANTGPAGRFFFNTVADNAGTGHAINCPSRLQLDDSIVVGNSKGGGTQFFGMCEVGATTVIGPSDSYATGVRQTPELVTFKGIGYALDPNGTSNKAFLIDKATAGFSWDYFGTARPQGAGQDVGAHEAR